MVLVTPSLITRPEDLIELIAQLVDESTLGFKYIAKYNERLIPEYPAIQIMAGTSTKEIHGTHTWAITLRADIYVMHADLTEDHATRTLTDMQLASSVVDFLETPNLSLGQRIIAGWVESEIPGVMPPRTAKGNAVISTRLGYRATTQGRF
jgi:hypothetical protein